MKVKEERDREIKDQSNKKQANYRTSPKISYIISYIIRVPEKKGKRNGCRKISLRILSSIINFNILI